MTSAFEKTSYSAPTSEGTSQRKRTRAPVSVGRRSPAIMLLGNIVHDRVA
jgi:hypothetical protein